MPKTQIRGWYILSFVVIFFAIIGLLAAINNINDASYTCSFNTYSTPSPSDVNDCVSNHISDSQQGILFSVFFLLFNPAFFIAWMGSLMNLSRARDWNCFRIVVFLSYIGVFLYLRNGPEPLPRGFAPVPMAQFPPPPAPYPPAQFPPLSATQPAISPAMAILQERYARGEIDTPTFVHMSEQLRATERPSS